VIELTVNDGTIDSASDEVTITATPPHVNATPVADAGPDKHAKAFMFVTLDGSKSADADSDSLTYRWTIQSTPLNSTPLFEDADTVSPTFVADTDGAYVIKLIVNDGTIDSASDTVTITATLPDANAPPVANAGTTQHVETLSLVTLDGSASSDADGDPLTYRWSLPHKPANSSASLNGADTVNPTFTADLDGIYLIQLVVNDGAVDSEVQAVGVVAETHTTAVLIGLGSHGGKDSAGTIQGIAITEGTSQPLFSFAGAPVPSFVGSSGLTHNTADGLFYGLLGGGGSYSKGAIFSYNPADGKIVTLYSFSGDDGTVPIHAPAISSDGFLYGTTHEGGQNDFGTLFRYEIATDKLTTLKHFTRDGTGHEPGGTPLVAKSGVVYGTLSGGTGAASGGTFWSYTPPTSSSPSGTFELLEDGLETPVGPLVDLRGYIHFSGRGGLSTSGAHYYWDPAHRKLTLVTAFINNTRAFCAQPAGIAFSDSTEKLFIYCQSNVSGTFPNVPVIVQLVDPTLTNLVKLHSFTDEHSGTFSHLIDAGFGGFLYAAFGSSPAVIYRVSASDYSASKIFTFPSDELGSVSLDLIAALDGKIYGMSAAGGDLDKGTVYAYDTRTLELTTTSLGYPNGSIPGSGMVKHSNGKLYGFTDSSVIEFDPITRAVRSFRLSHNTRMRPVEGADGTLYAISSGVITAVEVISIDPETLIQKTLKEIEPTAVSDDLTSRAIIVNGKLYGLSADGSGTNKLFEYDIAGNSSATVCTFPDGEKPVLGVTHDNGKLYGTTALGGDNSKGSIYACDIAGKSLAVLHSFGGGTDGVTPSSVLLLAKNGLLYGTTSAGGASNMGTLFSIDLSGVSPVFTTLHSFDGMSLTGEAPSGVLTEASDGKIYGAAYTDGTDSEVDGVVFAYDPVSKGLTVVQRASADFGFGTVYPELTETSLGGGL